MRTLKLTLAYDGTDFAGWQAQTNARNVQDTLEAAILSITGERMRVVASGRTDSGVHALAQVVSLTTNTHLSNDVLHRALNAELPNDVVVLAVESAADGFHAIRQAKRKRYRYLIHDGPLADVFLRRWCWKVWDRLDADKMHAAAQQLVGRHDFASFQSSGSERKTTVRTVYELTVARAAASLVDFSLGDGSVGDSCRESPSSTEPQQPMATRGASHPHLLAVEIEADGFLYNMVRAIVGALVEIGRGERDENWLAGVLSARDRRQAAATAPPQGLWLVRVEYLRP